MTNKGPLDNENISKKDRVESRSLRENIGKVRFCLGNALFRFRK